MPGRTSLAMEETATGEEVEESTSRVSFAPELRGEEGRERRAREEDGSGSPDLPVDLGVLAAVDVLGIFTDLEVSAVLDVLGVLGLLTALGDLGVLGEECRLERCFLLVCASGNCS